MNQKIQKTFRDNIALLMLISSFILLLALMITYYLSKGDIEKPFNMMVPLLATWVGTVLAFYFGKENFKAATEKYEKLITSLTPELLDDIMVNQIMIDQATMVYKLEDDISKKTVKDILDFLESVSKSRLPILDKNLKAKYVVHKSKLLEALEKDSKATLAQFTKEYELLITGFISVKSNTKLEVVRQAMNKAQNAKDIFVVNESGKVEGWLTDSLILRYINTKK